MRLFVDCDDTLILYTSEGEAHPFGFVRDEPYCINEPLVAFILAWRETHPHDLLVIWSGGGGEYAQKVAEEVDLHEYVEAVYMVKDRTTFALVGEDDIVVDDQELRVAATVTPPDFFDNKDNWGL